MYIIKIDNKEASKLATVNAYLSHIFLKANSNVKECLKKVQYTIKTVNLQNTASLQLLYVPHTYDVIHIK